MSGTLRQRIARRLSGCACCHGVLDPAWRTFAGKAVCKWCYALLRP